MFEELDPTADGIKKKTDWGGKSSNWKGKRQKSSLQIMMRTHPNEVYLTQSCIL